MGRTYTSDSRQSLPSTFGAGHLPKAPPTLLDTPGKRDGLAGVNILVHAVSISGRPTRTSQCCLWELKEASSLAARKRGASISSALDSELVSNPSHVRLAPLALVAKTGLVPVPASQGPWGLEGDGRQRLDLAPRMAE